MSGWATANTVTKKRLKCLDSLLREGDLLVVARNGFASQMNFIKVTCKVQTYLNYSPINRKIIVDN